MAVFTVDNARRLHAECDRIDAMPCETRSQRMDQMKAMVALQVRLARLVKDIRDGRLDWREVDRVCREAEGGLTWRG